MSNRPLLGVTDARLFVPPLFWDRLIAAVERDLNVLLVGPAGAGKTTALRMLALHDGIGRTSYIDLGPATTAAQALLLVVDGLGLTRPTALAESMTALMRPARSAPDGELLSLVSALGRAPKTLLLLDNPPAGEEGHRLFGRLRDALWQLEHQWVVSAAPQAAAGLERPPANAFFESRFELGALDDERQMEVLRRRLPEAGIVRLNELVGRVERPRELVTLAREALLDDAAPSEVAGQIEAAKRRVAELAEREQLLVAHLRSHGSAYSSDPALLAVLEVSQPRAASMLKKLAEQGVVTARQERHGQGRPRTVYELALEFQS